MEYAHTLHMIADSIHNLHYTNDLRNHTSHSCLWCFSLRRRGLGCPLPLGSRLQVLRHDSGWLPALNPTTPSSWARFRHCSNSPPMGVRLPAAPPLLPTASEGPPQARYSVALLTLPSLAPFSMASPSPWVVATVSPWLALDIQTRVLGLDGLGDDARVVLCSASGSDWMPSATFLTAARAPI